MNSRIYIFDRDNYGQTNDILRIARQYRKQTENIFQKMSKVCQKVTFDAILTNLYNKYIKYGWNYK